MKFAQTTFLSMNPLKYSYLFIFFLTIACSQRQEKFKGEYVFPPGYDYEKREKLILNEELDEISGITISPEGKIWAIQDDASVVYEMEWRKKRIIRKSKFAKNMDVEDVLWTGSHLFALRSNGDLYQITDPFTHNTDSEVYRFPFDGKNDIESVALYSPGQLLIICKKCEMDGKKNASSSFLFDLNTNTYEKADHFKLMEKKMRKLLPDDHYKLTVKPSAAALHPIENKFYILSSVGKWILIMDKNGEEEALYRIHPRVFKQAEGIAFDAAGNMYISNEAREGNANILFFPYKPQRQ